MEELPNRLADYFVVVTLKRESAKEMADDSISNNHTHFSAEVLVYICHVFSEKNAAADTSLVYANFVKNNRT